MRANRSIAIWCGSVLFAASAAAEPEVSASLTCAATAGVGTTLAMNVHLENRDCSPYNVRILTAIAGNANQTLSGIGVHGPVVAEEEVVPAATDHLPGTCSNPGGFGQCVGSSPQIICFAHADCVCRQTTPGVLDLPALSAPPQVPAAHVGTVESHLLVTEWKGAAGDTTLVNQCLVEVLP